MTTRINAIVRRLFPVLSAGCLFQANGCNVDVNSIASGVLTAIVNDLIASVVYGAFNLPVP